MPQRKKLLIASHRICINDMLQDGNSYRDQDTDTTVGSDCERVIPLFIIVKAEAAMFGS